MRCPRCAFVGEAQQGICPHCGYQIYVSSGPLQQNNSPYVTVVLGEPLDGSDEFLGSARGELEAVYLAQHEINIQNLLPSGLKLRILIANSGGDKNNVATIAQFIANRVAKVGNLDNIIAVIGWPYSSQTLNARDILAGVHIPTIPIATPWPKPSPAASCKKVLRLPKAFLPQTRRRSISTNRWL